MTNKISKAREALECLKDGYKYELLEGRWLRVENPKFAEDNGQDPWLLIDLREHLTLLTTLSSIDAERLGGEIAVCKKLFEKTFEGESRAFKVLEAAVTLHGLVRGE